jgi:hypothetical protein
VLLKLQARVAGGGEPTAWLRAVGRSLTFSEYMLYGVFVDEVLGLDASGHYSFGEHICLEDFATQPLGTRALGDLKQKLNGEALVMINAKSKTPVSDIRAAFGFPAPALMAARI